ncbi:reverse transcriptase family protein [Psychroserpens sp. SPM9]|uniref:reverse transcriptase family protein n=1 Tax=Psychroserpens sp. SPM9 TaxID=2975598 RepID=UPI0021A6240E|nr:reverse transcriptase family protein [Psychroserpens sp. SPM9]MDG5490730.1 reverse transcriptase family protein [Psychroserpens sp. SPM9]
MIRTTKHLAYTLKVDFKEIESIIKNIDNFYREKIEIKTDKFGKPKLDAQGIPKKRIIHPSKKRLKIIQKRIHRNILNKIEMPSYAYGAVKKKDNVDNAKKHLGKKYKFTTDLKDFFPSIKNEAVFKMFVSQGFSPTVARILTQLTTYKGQIPQGAPTSSTLANLVFIKTGDILNKFAKNNGATFTSFVDDMTFSSAKDFKNKIPEILKIITLDYKISHKKTNYSRNPNVTGLHVMNNHLELPKSFKEKLASTEGKSPQQIAGLLLYKEKVDRSNKGK